jgi:hypothetical protein
MINMRTVYVVVKGGIIIDAYADHLTDLVVLDLDTDDPEMLAEVNKKLKEVEESNDCIEIY